MRHPAHTADSQGFYPTPEATPQLKEFYRRLSERDTAPLWEEMAKLIPPVPEPATRPALWRYEDIRPLLMEAGELLGRGETERRVLMLRNPGLGGMPHVTQSLYAGLQLVMPDEIAPSHRHVTAALRLVIESAGAYTTVNGHRMTMEPGDFILTPSWTYHEHGNPGARPAIWVDCLDLPIVNLFGTSFAEHDPGEERDRSRPRGRGVTSGQGLHYQYRHARRTLDELSRTEPMDPCHGFRLGFPHPRAARYPIPTIGASLQLLPVGFRGEAYRSTDANVVCVLEGDGESRIEETVIRWSRHDIFVVPSWCPVSHQSVGGDSVLFSFSDRPAQEALGLWREQHPGSR